MYLCSKSQYRSRRESTIHMLQVLLLVQEQDGIQCTYALSPSIGVRENPLYLCSRFCSWYRSRMEWNTLYLCSGSCYRSRMESTVPVLQVLVKEQDGIHCTCALGPVQEQDGIHCTCALGPGIGVGWNPMYLCSRSWYRSRMESTVPVLQVLYRSRMESTVPVLQVLVKDRDEIHCTSALGSGIKEGWECTCALGPGTGVGWKRNEMDNTRLGTHQQSIQPSAISNQYKY